VLTVVSFRLINVLNETKRRQANFLLRNGVGGSCGIERRNELADRTTRMLLAVLILFLITELPQGILGLLSALHGDQFFTNCYAPLGELMDFLALLNSAINFVLYCNMSKKFRQTFTATFSLNLIPARFNSFLTNLT
jgi:hypothetical protein